MKRLPVRAVQVFLALVVAGAEFTGRRWAPTLSGVPAASGTWHYDAATKEVVVTVRQTQAADSYRLTLGVGLVQTAGALPVVREMAVDVIDPVVSTLAEFGTFVKTLSSR